MEMSSDIPSIMAAIGVKAKEAATQIAVASSEAKNKAKGSRVYPLPF